MSRLKENNESIIKSHKKEVIIFSVLASMLSFLIAGKLWLAYAAQDTKLDEQLGATTSVVSYLESHENDGYFLGTPYGVTGPNAFGSITNCDAMYPNGDRKSNGDAYLNCAGFVAYVMRSCGANIDEIGNYTASNGYNKGTYTNASKWFYYCQDKGIGYKFNSIADALNSGVLSKGDIIYLDPNWSEPDADCHIGFFWGNSSNENKFWHSATHPGSGNQISEITGKSSVVAVYVFKTSEGKGGIELTKTSSNTGITDGNSCYSVAGAQYGIWDNEQCSGDPIKYTSWTDESGYCSTLNNDFKLGKYYVKETTPPTGYALDTTGGPNGNGIYPVDVSVSNGFSRVTYQAKNLKDNPQNDPVGILLGKVDAQTTENMPEGSASLKGARFEVTYYDVQGQGNQDGVSKSVVDAIAGQAKTTRTWTFETDDDGTIALHESYKISGDELYYYQKLPTLPIGTIVIHEVQAPTGYLNNNKDVYWIRSVTAEGNTETVETYDAPNGDTAIKEQVKKGDVSITKHDLDSDSTTPQGEADLSGIKFMIKNVSENSVVVDGTEYAKGADITNSVITTDKQGNACTTGKRLPYGDYEIREICKDAEHGDYANESYMLSDTAAKKFQIREDGEVVTKDVNGSAMIFKDEVVRGGVSVEKRDTETKASCALGGATLAGTKFQIKLKEGLKQNPVYVNGKWYKEGEIIDLLAGDATYNVEDAHDLYPSANVKATLITDEDGKVETSADALPYGTYTIQEVAASTGYLLTDGTERTFSVRENAYIKPYKQQGENGADEAFYNQAKRANLSFSKKMEGTSNRGKWIPFLLTSKSTGETHIVVTDENGYFDTDKVPHSQNTNALDSIVREATDADEFYIEWNGKKYTYNSDWIREATDDDHYYLEVNGKKYTLNEEKVMKAAAEFGVWFGLDVDGNIANVSDDLAAMPYDTELFDDGGYILQELPCNANYGYKLVTANLSARQNNQSIDYGTLDDEQKPTIIVSKQDTTTGDEVPGATLLLEKKNDNGEWEKVEEWVSTTEPHKVENQTVGKYRLTETLTPKTYEQAEAVEFEVLEGETTKQVTMKDKPIEITGEIDKRQNKIYETGDDGAYIYTVDYRSTSNTWADEMNMWDTLDCAVDGKAYLQYINTPVVNGDYDGKMNVWYKTNKTDAADTTDSSKYNACSTNPANPHNENNERVHDFTGWKLWKADVSVLKSETLQVSELALADGEYVTGVAFEHGRVEVGAGSEAQDSKQWTRDDEKNESDFIDEASDNFMTKTVGEDGVVSVFHKDTFKDADGNEVTYQPAVFGMLPTEEALADETIEYWNTADMDIHRNLAPEEEKLNDDDEDKVVQKTSLIYLSKVDATTGEEVEGAELKLEIQDSDGSWRVVDEWTSTNEVHKKGGVIGARYRLTETFAPKTYLVSDPIEFTFNGDGAANKIVMTDEPISITGQIDKRESALYDIDDDGAYIYTIDYRSTSNTWADEMNMWDVIDCAVDGKAFLEYFNTPVMFGDYDGEMNVWFKTNKTAEDYVEPEDEDGNVPNACGTNPDNPHNPSNERVHDFTGWKCWGKVSTLESTTITVKDLGLDDDEYVTGIAFEHGRVEVGAGTNSQDSNQWTRDFLKDESDIIGADKDAYVTKTVDEDGITTVKHGTTFNDADGKAYTYQPVVIGMRATEETMKEGGIELYNTADMDIHRNLAPEEPTLNDEDEDKVVLKTPRIGTKLTDKATGTHDAYPSKDTTLVDKVEYEGLIAGKEYIITGKLYDKETGEPLIAADKEVEARDTFIPADASGTTEIEFTFDSSSMLGKTTVAFEDLYYGEKLIYSEHDLENADQTVTFKETPTTPDNPSNPSTETKKGGYYDKTGNDMNFALIMLSAGIAAVGYIAGVWCIRKAGGIAAVKAMFKK